MIESMRARAKALYNEGKITQVLAWEEGVFLNYPIPAFFTDPKTFDNLVYNRFCSANLGKLLIGIKQKTLVFLRLCDAQSLKQLMDENQVSRENIYIIAVDCEGIVAVHEGEEQGLLHQCQQCMKTDHPIFDEVIHIDLAQPLNKDENNQAILEEVQRVTSLTNEEKYSFWQSHLARCIRCNACRNICPTCYCKACILDNNHPLEGQFYHVLRALHQSERCTLCGQCSRVCPQAIPLHLLNEKLKQISDVQCDSL